MIVAGEEQVALATAEVARFDADFQERLAMEPLAPSERSILRMYFLACMTNRMCAPLTYTPETTDASLRELDALLASLQQPALRTSEKAILRTFMAWSLGQMKQAERSTEKVEPIQEDFSGIR